MEDLGEPHARRPISFLGAALWTSAIGLLASVAVQVTDQVRPGAALDLVNITACCVLAYSALLFAMLRVYAPEGSVRAMLGFRPASPVACVLAAVAGGALSLGTVVLDEAMAKRFPLSQEDADRMEQILRASTVGERVVLIVSVAVVVPLFEETFYRGAIFGGLRRGRTEWLAVIGSAGFFALSRMDPRAIASALVLGLLAAWLRGRSGSVVLAVVANAAYSGTPLIPLAMGRGDYDVAPRVAIAGVVVAAASVGAAGWLFARDARAERSRALDV